MDDDELIPIRSCYYIGDFAGVNKQAKNLKGLRGLKAKERDSYVIRGLIAQKKFSEAETRLSQIDPSSTSTPLLSLRQQLRYRMSIVNQNERERQQSIEELTKYLSNSDLCKNVCFLTCACETLILEEKYDKCLEVLYKNTEVLNNNLELLYININVLLLINRKDLALKKLDLMSEIDDDDPCTILANVIINLMSNTKISHDVLNQECIDKLEDLISGLKETSLLTNLLSVIYIHKNDFRNAWRKLQKSKELSTKSDGLSAVPMSTLVNGIVCLQHLSKGQATLPKLASDLSKNEPNNSFLSATAEMGSMYDRCAKSFDVHVKKLDD